MNNHQSYKQSEIDWVGEIPSHWETVQPKYRLNRVTRPIEEDDEVITCFRDGVVTLRKNRREEGFTNSIKEHGYQQIKPGDLVVHEMDGFAGAIGVSDSKGKATPVYTVIEPDGRADLSYVAYLLKEMSRSGKIESLARSIRERTTDFRWNMWSVINFPFPPIEEQNRISRYLDKKTNQIDSLINKIHKKIELLKEQRTSLINQCVTKGLDSNVEMKDSGVEWIGEIPKHWEIIRLGYISNLFVGYPFKSDEFNHDDGIRLVRGENVSEGFFRWGERSRYWKSSIGLEEYLLEENDIVVGMDGSKVGKNVCRINSEDLPMLLVQRICRIRINEENLSKWVYQSLRSLRFQTWVNLSKTDPLVPHITQKNIHDFKIHLPPRNEMELLLKALSTKLRRVDKVLEMEEKRLKLYKQYRESLISSVVTGKVRVTEDMV